MRASSRKRNGYTAKWIQNGGNVLAVDPNPSVTGLPALMAADRILKITPSLWKPAQLNGALATLSLVVSVWLADGVSASVQLWQYDDAKDRWWPLLLGAPTALTYAAVNRSTAVIRSIIGQKFFVQVTAVNGVTKIATDIV